MSAIVDPDLECALEDLRWDAMRLQQIEEQLIKFDPVKDYRQLAAKRQERADLRETIAGRASILNISPSALMLLIDQSNRMRTAKKSQLPSLAALAAAISTIRAASERDMIEAEAELVCLRHRGAAIQARRDASVAAITYLQASR